MLDDLDRSLRTLLEQQLPQVLEKIEADGFEVSFDIPNRDFKSRLTKPTLSLYLYNVQENRDMRGQTWQVERSNGAVSRKRPPVKVDCSYMVTAWSNEVEDEHRLLTGAARVLLRNGELPKDVLQGSLANNDDIEIPMDVAQPTGLKDVVDIWSVLDNDLRPAVRLTATIPLEVDVSYDVPPVGEREIRVASPEWSAPPSAPVAVSAKLVRGGKPVSGALIRADSSTTTTDAEGEFSLRAVRPGRTTFLVRAGDAFYQLEADVPLGDELELPEESGGKPDDNGESGKRAKK